MFKSITKSTFLFFLVLGSFAQAEDKQLQIPNVMTCKLKDVYAPYEVSKSVIKVQTGENSFVSSQGVQNAELNFKFGRGYVAGKKINPDSDIKCESVVKHTATAFSFEYNCEEFITNGNGTKESIRRMASRIFLTDWGQSNICKSLGAGMSPCWDIQGCDVFPVKGGAKLK